MALAEFAFNRMRDRRANDRHLNEMALRIFDALAHGLRDFSSLAQPYADMAVLIAHNHERGEAEILAALGDLRNAVDEDKPFLEFHGGCLSTLLHVLPP